MELTLPLDYAAIERILPHRFPFLLVDRITEFEVDKRIVGIKNVSLDERYLSHTAKGLPVLPPTILTEAVAQVGGSDCRSSPASSACAIGVPSIPATWSKSKPSSYGCVVVWDS